MATPVAMMTDVAVATDIAVFLGTLESLSCGPSYLVLGFWNPYHAQTCVFRGHLGRI